MPSNTAGDAERRQGGQYSQQTTVCSDHCTQANATAALESTQSVSRGLLIRPNLLLIDTNSQI